MNHIYVGEAFEVPTGRAAMEECSKYMEAGGAAASSTGPGRHAWPQEDKSPRRGRASEPADVLYGTAYAQRAIWEHQHPADCSSAKFLAMYHWPIGMGALLHFLGRALGLAMHVGRVLVLAEEAYGADSMALWPGPGGMPWHDRALCGNARSWECWFQPLSNCSPAMSGEKASDILTVWPSDLVLFRKGNFSWHFVPHALQHLVRQCSRVKRRLEFYWWHAQAVTYIVRFNQRARRLLDVLRCRLLHLRRRGASASSSVLDAGLNLHCERQVPMSLGGPAP